MTRLSKTKIVCTIGPASSSSDTIKALIESGMSVARLNFSHGSHEDHAESIRNIRHIAKVALAYDKGFLIRFAALFIPAFLTPPFFTF